MDDDVLFPPPPPIMRSLSWSPDDNSTKEPKWTLLRVTSGENALCGVVVPRCGGTPQSDWLLRPPAVPVPLVTVDKPKSDSTASLEAYYGRLKKAEGDARSAMCSNWTITNNRGHEYSTSCYDLIEAQQVGNANRCVSKYIALVGEKTYPVRTFARATRKVGHTALTREEGEKWSKTPLSKVKPLASNQYIRERLGSPKKRKTSEKKPDDENGDDDEKEAVDDDSLVEKKKKPKRIIVEEEEDENEPEFEDDVPDGDEYEGPKVDDDVPPAPRGLGFYEGSDDEEEEDKKKDDQGELGTTAIKTRSKTKGSAQKK